MHNDDERQNSGIGERERDIDRQADRQTGRQAERERETHKSP